MAQSTQPFKQSLSGSVGAGMKSVFASGGRRFYTLVHKVSSKYYQAGESQQIIVDQITIGRDPSCQVRFDESFSTVSRKHAAIVKDGDNWKLVQLSQTNSTYLNGHKVHTEWYLQNGDEIQLSTNGPKLGFIIPEGKKGLVSSINLTARLNLFRKQALRPYKTALWSISAVFVAALCVGGYFLYESISKNKELDMKLADVRAEYDQYKKDSQETMQNLSENYEKVAEELKAKSDEVADMQQRLEEIRDMAVNVSGINNAAIEACIPYVYYIELVGIDATWPDGSKVSDGNLPAWSGTGFLLADGRFVTARHVVEGWSYFGNDERLAMLNVIANNGGKVVAHFMAVSSSGSRLQFTSEDFYCDRSHDVSYILEDGKQLVEAPLDETDFAYMRTSAVSGLKYDLGKSRNLERGTVLTVLGFPLGLGANDVNDINPIYGSGTVAKEGLQDGYILITDTNYEQGNSGGPVFYTDKNGDLTVVGIVSAGAGRTTGFVVPISVIN
ncbi:MAG TPA: FHA domain-containing protein [Candidatus Coprenecus pullistercoris]|nr:FHA domain-containing protein [Candidatus Coprenecus pullistercoris]